jgi:site-specific recombinase XerD
MWTGTFRFKLIDWLAGRGVQLAYGNKTLSILRQFLEKARRKELHTNVKYQGMGWLVTKKKAKTTPVTLTPEELQLLYDMPLHGYLKKVRDLFLIGAGTGQRFSDYSRLCP